MIQNAYYSQTPYSLNILSYIQATLFASNRSRARMLRHALPVFNPRWAGAAYGGQVSLHRRSLVKPAVSGITGGLCVRSVAHAGNST